MTAETAWERLYAGALASSFVWKFAQNEADGWLADDVLSAALSVEQDAVVELASDRGEVTRARWEIAALRVLELRLASRNGGDRGGVIRARIEGHVAKLRAKLAERAS